MEERISLANLDTAIAEAVKGTNFGKGRIIYGFVPPDWFEFDEAFKIAETVTTKLDTGGDIKPAVMKLNTGGISVLDKIRDPYIVGFIGPIDPTFRK